MKVVVCLALCIVLTQAVPWYKMEAAQEAQDSRLAPEHIAKHWEEFKATHCKFIPDAVSRD